MKIKQGYGKGTVRRSSSKNTHPAGRKAPTKRKILQPVDVRPEWSSVATSVKINTSERRHRASRFSAEPAQHLRLPSRTTGVMPPAELRRWKREFRARHILSGGPGPKKTRHARRSALKSDTLARKCDSKALLCGAVPPNAPTAAK